MTAFCPLCKKPAVDPYTPFCSKRCSEIDLHRWLVGVYALPAEPDEEALEDEEEER